MTPEPIIESGAIVEIPLNRLKKSPKNARRTPHGEAAIAALAASIAVKGVLQAPVVEPETDEVGVATGYYLVTIGEGRRQALLLRAKHKEIRKSDPVRCVVDTANDPHEISLDENVTRADMHPADQFEAFQRLADERGYGAEEIGARFGVSAQVVRQRLRLGAVSPKLMALYRESELTLDQLMAFAVSDDHERQEQVLETLSFNRSPSMIRRAMTEAKVPVSDRRARFVGEAAYTDAGGTVLRDLFTEDGGGWFEDVALLDRLAAEGLAWMADDLRAAEGWLWATASLDYPHGHGLRRVYPQRVERSPKDQATFDGLWAEHEALTCEWDAAEDIPPEVEARFLQLAEAINAFGDGTAYDPEEVARGGVMIVLGLDGAPRVERGFIRPEDEPPVASDDAALDGELGGREVQDAPLAEAEAADDIAAPLSERLVLDLTAYRTIGLRDAVAVDPPLALAAMTHALAIKTFYPPYEHGSCVELRITPVYLEGHAPGIAESPAGRRIAERHDLWAARMPKDLSQLWDYVQGLDGGALLELLAHCVSLGVNAVRSPMDRRPGAWAHADVLARAARLDMRQTWTATAQSFFGRITKPRILDAVREAKGDAAAAQIADLKKAEMAEAAERLVSDVAWLPELLHTPCAPAEPTRVEPADEAPAPLMAAE